MRQKKKKTAESVLVDCVVSVSIQIFTSLVPNTYNHTAGGVYVRLQGHKGTTSRSLQPPATLLISPESVSDAARSLGMSKRACDSFCRN